VPLRKKGDAYHHGDLRQALVDAAIQVVARHGADGLSLRELARRLGVSHQAPYRHFADKRALLEAVAAAGFAVLFDRMRAAIRNPDPVAGLIESGVAYVRFALEHPAQYRVMFGARELPSGRPTENDPGDTVFRGLVATIERCQQAGMLPAAPSRDLAVVCWSIVHGLAMLAVDDKLGPRAEAELTVRRSVELAVRSLDRR
jgi:AcrR family transcriptional regulator